MKTAWDIVKAARNTDRPTTYDFIENIFSNFIEFHGDRLFADDAAIIGGIAYFDDIPVTIIGIQKGRNVDENIKRNFGMPNPEGYRKALRLMKQAEKFKRPVITFVNTAGAFCGIGAEERGQGEAIAKNLFEMSALRVPIISIFTGEGGSGGALALAVADRVWMLSNAMYSVLSPEGFASILWKDSNKAKAAAELMKITATDMLQFGIIDLIFEENAHLYANISNALRDELKLLMNKDMEVLLEERYNRFRSMGNYKTDIGNTLES